MSHETPPAPRRGEPPSEHGGAHEEQHSLASLFAALAEEQPQPRQKRPKKRRGKAWIVWLSVLLVLLLGLGAGGAVVWSQYGERISLALGWSTNDFSGEGHGEAIVTIRSGDIGEDIARTLADAGVVKTSQVFYELLLEQSPAVEFHAGTFRLKLGMSSRAALSALQDPANEVRLTAVIPEGKTVEQTLELVAEGSDIPLEQLLAAAENPQDFGLPEGIDSLEGWLYPATYQFEPSTTAHEAIAMMVDHQIEMLDELGVAVDDRERVLTIASIVQREAGTADDFGKVARVIFNRLDEGMRLEMDSTAQFGIGQHLDGSVWSSADALRDDNPWNTYVHEGLPIGPIASPGRQAVEAVLRPDQGEWLYFVAVNLDTGESVFSNTFAEHRVATEQLHAWCEANPSANC